MPAMAGMDMSSHATLSGHAMLMPGMLTAKQMEALKEAKGEEFDRLFLNGMIQHQQRRFDYGEGLVRHSGRGQDAGTIQFRDRCRQWPTRRDQDYGNNVGWKTFEEKR